ncbi:hypothetical protein HPB50_020716 [Hyalomma asiaticum]|uniref:Uncharacterized protein n=1 Tax=Hyalomma asiaticum TaxID=266040 RepID=A0ACB7TQP3_HYAAI|nr:hypothetical protein HPB50_020716 [Hyalomma asiaticum]
MSSSLPAAKKRKQFSLSEKVDILRQLDEGKKQAVVAKEHGVAHSTIATILKDKDKIMKCQEQSQLAPSRKCLRLGDYQQIDSANCWRKAGLLQTGEQPRNDDEGNPGELWTEVTDLLAIDSVSFDNYVSSDEAARTSAELTTEDILSTIQDDAGSDEGCGRCRGQ